MKKFALIFRMDILNEEAQPSAEQMNSYMEDWSQWLSWISAQEKLATGGNHFQSSGVVLRKNEMTNGPYVSNNESIAGYINIMVKDEAEAIRIAKKCPILKGKGTSVEIRLTEGP